MLSNTCESPELSVFNANNPTMSRGVTLPLLRGTTTFQSRVEEEEDMLLALDYPEQRIEFFVSLYSKRADIVDIVSYHLGLTLSDTCWLGEVSEWIHGSFNVCIPVYIRRPNQPPGN